jgi:hypothetical protein
MCLPTTIASRTASFGVACAALSSNARPKLFFAFHHVSDVGPSQMKTDTADPS